MPNLADKVVFDGGSSDSKAQVDSPIPLDMDSAQRHIKKWIEEEAHGNEIA